MKLARTLLLDASDRNIFPRAAESGEWAVPGSFEFANWAEERLKGRDRQAFANGWLGLESLGRATFVVVTPVEPAERDLCVERLAAHFVADWGAPSLAAALPVAEREVAFMEELCAGHVPNTLLALERAMTPEGLRETYRAITPAEAELEALAVHATPDPPGGWD